MKKVMSILTVAAFLVGAAGIVSFTVKQQQNDEDTAWFYVVGGQPTEMVDEGNIDCEDEGPVCAQQYFLDGENQPTDPTGNPIHGVRPQ